MKSIRILLGKIVKGLSCFKRYKERNKEMYHFLTMHLGHEPSEKQFEWCLGDFYIFKRRYKGYFNDYFNALLYRKSDFVRMESFANSSNKKWRSSIQDKRYREIFDNKKLFYCSFDQYLNRAWMIVDDSTSFDAFADFVERCQYEVVVKEPLGYGGKGVSFYRLSNDEKEIRQLYDVCRKDSLLIEEKIVQCDEIRSFAPNSVNSFRIITIIDKYGTAHVARAAFRIGRGNSDLDNYSSGGMATQIDIKTGIVYTTARDGRGREYILHPDTGKQIIGYKIEDWQAYKDFVIELAMQYPTVRYVGWDIAKNKNGDYVVIEGNHNPGFSITEGPSMYGLKPLFMDLAEGKEIKRDIY